jgi:SAM-dependent methyltransferase
VERLSVDWHARFRQQAAWTRELRSYLFERAGLARAERILEVGCGTGAILAELDCPAALHGLDRDAGRLAEAGRYAPRAWLVCGDALHLPYPDASFDIVFCHFLLLWVGDPRQALQEMCRVARPGGSVLALAEPDYTARVDEPPGLAPLGRAQTEALRAQGADPGLGGKLGELFRQAGLPPLETGTLRGGEASRPTPEQRALEWAVLADDLRGRVPAEELQRLQALDERAWAEGTRRLYVPTHFAWARVGRMV